MNGEWDEEPVEVSLTKFNHSLLHLVNTPPPKKKNTNTKKEDDK